MHTRLFLTIAVCVGACGGNTQAQRDAAKAAADAFCECAANLTTQPPASLPEARKRCAAEDDAWKKAWAGLPKGAAGDDKAAAISQYKSGCEKIMLDAILDRAESDAQADREAADAASTVYCNCVDTFVAQNPDHADGVYAACDEDLKTMDAAWKKIPGDAASIALGHPPSATEACKVSLLKAMAAKSKQPG